MSTYITDWQFGEASRNPHLPQCGFITVGYPIAGFEHYGNVTAVSRCNGPIVSCRTERDCPAMLDTLSYDHALASNGLTLACRNCALVIPPLVIWTYGFDPHISADGTLTCDVARYDDTRHGPYGAHDLTEALEKAEAHRERWLAFYGPGPWYAVEHDEPDRGQALNVFSSRDFSPPGVEGLSYFYAGPFDKLEDARIACSQRADLIFPSSHTPWYACNSQIDAASAAFATSSVASVDDPW